MRRLVLLATICFSGAACGPKPKPVPIATLPGDGDKNTVKPPTDVKPVVNDPWAGKSDLIVAPAPKPPAPIEFPAFENYKLSNGLDVYVIKNDRLPTISMQIAVKAGRMHEPRARLGVSDFTAEMLVKGTKKRDAVALAKAIDFVGGTIGADATHEATLLTCSVLSKNASTCMQLLPEILTQPSFPDTELTKVREKMLGGVRARLDDAGSLAAAHAQNLLWGQDHVRGWIPDERSVAAVKRDDIVAWHKQWFVPNNAMLVIAGDVNPKTLKPQLEAAFGVWRKGVVPPTPQYKMPGLSGSRIRLVDKPGQTQTHIRIAQFGIEHQDPRFFDTLVWNYALGGGAFSSRLMRVVRVEGGKTYGASSSFDRNLDRGSFVAQTFTRNSEAIATTKLVLDQIAKMAKEGPTQDEVSAAIANIAGGYGLRFQSASDMGSALVAAELHRFGREYLMNFPIAVGKVTVESAKQSAAEILDPRSFVIVLVGDAKDIEPQLKKEGWKYQKVAFTDPITEPVVVPDKPADANSTAAAKKLIDEALVAKGKAKLQAMKAFKMIANGTTTINGQVVPVKIERLLVLPDKMRIDALLASRFKLLVSVEGQKGWNIAPDQTGKPQLADIQPADFQSIEFERWRDPELILLRALEPNARIQLAADETIDGKPCSVFTIRAPNGVDVSVYVDKKTKLVTRMKYEVDGTEDVDNFSNFKEVGGIKVAHTRQSAGAGRGETKLELESVEIDPKFDPKIFEKPKSVDEVK